MRPLNIVLDKNSGLENVIIIHFEGDFDGSSKDNLEEVQKEIESCTSGGAVIFELSMLNYLNSFALSEMVAWHNVIEGRGGQILLVGINDHIKDIFMVLGVDSIFKVYNTLEEAKAVL